MTTESQFNRFVRLLEEMNLKADVKPTDNTSKMPGSNSAYRYAVEIDEGGAGSIFYFDETGNCMGHGVWAP
jgi:hypothetical protein